MCQSPGPQHEPCGHPLVTNILKTNVWPISKSELIGKHFKVFYKFINYISFDKLTNSEPSGD